MEAPRLLHRQADADARAAGDAEACRRAGREEQAAGGGQVGAVVASVQRQGLRQLARPRAQGDRVGAAAARRHRRQTCERFERTDQDQPVAAPVLGHHVEHPVQAVVQVNIGRARRVGVEENPRRGAGRRVAGRIAPRRVAFDLDDPADATTVHHQVPKQGTGHHQMRALEERAGQGNGSHGRAARLDPGPGRGRHAGWWLG